MPSYGYSPNEANRLLSKVDSFDDDNFVKKSGDTMSGQLTINNLLTVRSPNAAVQDSVIRIEKDSSNGGFIKYDAATNMVQHGGRNGTTDTVAFSYSKSNSNVAFRGNIVAASANFTDTVTISDTGSCKFVIHRTDSQGNISIGFKNQDSATKYFGLRLDGHIGYSSTINLDAGYKLYSTGFKPTKADVGLSSLNNWATATSVTDGSATKYANAAIVKAAYDNANTKISAVNDGFTNGLVSFNKGLKVTGSNVITFNDNSKQWCNGTNHYMELGATNGSFQIRDSHNTKVTISNTGTIVAQGDITAMSDIRIKSDITVIDNALDKVTQLRGVNFSRENNKRGTGVIAQEVEKVLPEAVITNAVEGIEGFKSVAYGNMVGLLIEAIKELNLKINVLEKRLGDE